MKQNARVKVLNVKGDASFMTRLYWKIVVKTLQQQKRTHYKARNYFEIIDVHDKIGSVYTSQVYLYPDTLFYSFGTLRSMSKLTHNTHGHVTEYPARAGNRVFIGEHHQHTYRGF